MTVLSETKPSSQNTLALEKAWQAIQPDSCPSVYNFHMHTVYSDGQLTPEKLIKQAIDIGLSGLAITDHHCIDGFMVAQSIYETLSHQQPEIALPHLWTGVEVTSLLLGIEVHLLGYSFDPTHWALSPYLRGKQPNGSDAEAKNVIEAIHQAGGLVVLAHPSRYYLSAHELISSAAQLGIDGVETYYAYGNPKPWQTSRVQTETAQQLAEQYNLYSTCGTDTHGLNLLQRI